ncbi:MAG TPA: DUF5615 family PIN-like protein [Actinomycetes bacterium]
MRLLLDEHYSPEIARQLRTRGHDVVAVAERADLVGLGDEEFLRRMAREQRAIMTNNVKDFLPLVGRAAVAADDHAGLLLTSDRSMPRRSDAIGRFVEALDAFLQRHQGSDAYRNQVPWLSAPGVGFTRGGGGSACG